VKYPKHRTTIYTVTRSSWDSYEQVDTFTIIDSFRTLERAEEVCGAFQKEAIDRGLGAMLKYETMASTYYNE
jgi:hypothetical protein